MSVYKIHVMYKYIMMHAKFYLSVYKWFIWVYGNKNKKCTNV